MAAIRINTGKLVIALCSLASMTMGKRKEKFRKTLINLYSHPKPTVLNHHVTAFWEIMMDYEVY